MFNFKKTMTRMTAAAVLAFTASTANAAIINLGFSLDESGSVGSSNFALTRDALADALIAIPTSGDNQYRLAVTAFSSSSNQKQIIAPTIVTAANLATLQATLKGESYSGGLTDTAGAIDFLVSLFTPFSSDLTLFNITTDGSPNSQSATESSALAAYNAFVDGISFEAVGSGINSPSALANMARIAGLGTAGDAANGVVVANFASIPNASTTGFVIPVADFAGYSAAINAKIIQIVQDTGGGADVPAPSTLAMMSLVLLGFGARKVKYRRA